MLTEDYLNIAYDPEAPKNAILLWYSRNKKL
jgi:hypothetical protein